MQKLDAHAASAGLGKFEKRERRSSVRERLVGDRVEGVCARIRGERRDACAGVEFDELIELRIEEDEGPHPASKAS